MEWAGIRISNPRSAASLLVLVAVAAHFWSLGYRPFHLAPFGGRHDAAPINLDAEPIQSALLPGDPESIVVKHGGAVAIVEPKQRYEIAGRVVLTDLYYTDGMSIVSPVDLSLIWGKLATDPKALKGISFQHYLRFGAFQWSGATGVDAAMFKSHFSNNHLIPSTDRIKQALTSVDAGDRVVLSGYLVNVTASPKAGGAAFYAESSLTRDDTGAGACEIMYVTRVRIKDAWY
jgi:hypothetical protein